LAPIILLRLFILQLEGKRNNITYDCFLHQTRYLINRHDICPPSIDCDLAILCLVYLTLPEFTSQISDIDIEQAILRGTYAFLEYASSFWGLHIESGLQKLDDVVESQYPNITLLRECLGTFLEQHWNPSATLEAKNVPSALCGRLRLLKEPDLSKRSLHDINLFEQESQDSDLPEQASSSIDLFDQATIAIFALKLALRPTGKNSAVEDTLLVYGVFKKIRDVFELIVSSKLLTTDTKSTIMRQYGALWFKCSRLNCRFFHQGFQSKAHRQQHLEKHDRSYTCSFEGCSQYTIGYTTAKDLEVHMFDCHGIRRQNENQDFPDEEEQPKEKKQSQKHPAIFQCGLCPKRFTRTYNLRAHERTHTGERRFMCSTCGQAFSRRYDRKRHEDLHSGKSQFRCEGVLEDGSHWGCGKKFARLEALHKHCFKSPAGRLCVKKLMDKSAPEQGIQENTDGNLVNSFDFNDLDIDNIDFGHFPFDYPVDFGSDAARGDEFSDHFITSATPENQIWEYWDWIKISIEHSRLMRNNL
jgi:C2H2 type zinc finger protein